VNVVHLQAVQAARRVLPPPELVARSADLLALLANRTRLNILLALLPRGTDRPELCVCDLAVVCGASQSLISHQLRLLRTAGLVAQRREGKLAYYRLTSGPTTALLRSVLDLAPGAASRGTSMDVEA
jgi:ArsR family transcriptional regulator